MGRGKARKNAECWGVSSGLDREMDGTGDERPCTVFSLNYGTLSCAHRFSPQGSTAVPFLVWIPVLLLHPLHGEEESFPNRMR